MGGKSSKPKKKTLSARHSETPPAWGQNSTLGVIENHLDKEVKEKKASGYIGTTVYQLKNNNLPIRFLFSFYLSVSSQVRLFRTIQGNNFIEIDWRNVACTVPRYIWHLQQVTIKSLLIFVYWTNYIYWGTTTSPNEVTLYSHVKAHSHKLHFMLWTVADHCVSTEIEALQCFLSVEMQWPIAFPEWIAASLNEP